MTSLSIVIINYNGEQFLKPCIDSVIAQKNFGHELTIIVIDNNSTDHSIDILNEYDANITLISNKTNTGFARAVNQSLPYVNTDYIWLLNNDTEFSHNDDILSPIISYLNQLDNW